MASFIFLIRVKILKISETGKKKLERQIRKWVKDPKAFMKEYGFCKQDDYYTEIENIVWNYVGNNHILSMITHDPDSLEYIDNKILELYEKI